MSVEELEKKIGENTEKIEKNLSKIEENLSKINANEKNIQKNSIAFEILKDYKRENKRLFFIIISMLVLWVITLFIFHL